MAADLDLGVAPIDTEAVKVPTGEAVTAFMIQLTRDQEWSQFPVQTTQRQHNICPGTSGQEDFAGFCEKVKAMIETAEGQAVLAAIKAELAKKPIVLETRIKEVGDVEA